MTRYSNDDMDGNWEFKIVRSGSNAFRRPEVFQNLVEEEAIAGWQLVEKLDNGRVRFKRPQDARRNDAMLPPDIDPYRTQFDAGLGGPMVGISIGLLVLGALGAVFMFNRTAGGTGDIPWVLIAIVGGGVVTIGLAVLIAARSR